MKTLFEGGFLLALILPPVIVVIGACTTLGASFVQWRSRDRYRRAHTSYAGMSAAARAEMHAFDKR